MTDSQKTNIMVLRADGMTYSDIADKLQISINTVKSFYRRCEKKLRFAANAAENRYISLSEQEKRNFALIGAE